VNAPHRHAAQVAAKPVLTPARLWDASVRRSIEDEIERLIGLLDLVEPDPDLEPWLAGDASNTGDRESDNCDLEEQHDAEPSEDGETVTWGDDLKSQEVLVSL